MFFLLVNLLLPNVLREKLHALTLWNLRAIFSNVSRAVITPLIPLIIVKFWVAGRSYVLRLIKAMPSSPEAFLILLILFCLLSVYVLQGS